MILILRYLILWAFNLAIVYLYIQDIEGREVAIKIDKQEGKELIIDNACKAYLEMRSEVSILQPLKHPNIIEFIG